MPKRAQRATTAEFTWLSAVVCLSLLAAVWAVFGQTVRHQFVNFDDEVYVYQNPKVTAGLTSDSITWAFTHSHARNWHPLTTLSHMLDCSIYGVNPAGHHLTNVLLHGVSAVLLFIVLRQMTGAVWPSAFVAAVWAIHPLRVESVAWIAERKDVLSGVFFVLTLGAYMRYVRAPRATRYVVVVGCFAAGLLCKPMLVTLPLVLLLLDYWPLRRFGASATANGAIRKAVIDKVPLLALSGASSIATFAAQTGTGAMDPLPLLWRIENAIATAAVYLVQIVWPAALAPFYPHPAGSLAVAQVALAAAVLAAVTFVAFGLRRTAPWLLVGWSWYLIILVPVIGIVQIGMQGRADRYTYLPHIGIYIAVAWSMRAVPQLWHFRRHWVMTCAAGLFLIVMTCVAWSQTRQWHDSRTLWTHTADVTADNEVAENNLGILLQQDGRIDEAISHYQRAIAIQTQRGHARYRTTLALSRNNLGNAWFRKGEIDQAIAQYRAAVALRPDYADAFYNLGIALLEKGELDGAIGSLETALSLRPADAAVHVRLGDALRRKRADAEALVHYQKALELEPTALWAHDSLAWLLATCSDSSIRNGARSLEIARDALRLPGGDNALTLRTLAAAYATQGDFGAAVHAAERGLHFALAQRDIAILQSLQSDLELYRGNVPLREISPVE